MKTFLHGGLALGVGLVFGTQAQANLILNGSFEAGNFNYSGSGWSYNSVPAGDSTTVTGWTATESGFDWHRAVEFGPAYDGDFMIDLTYGSAIGGIAQTFATTAGQLYAVSFALAAPQLSLQNPRLVDVTVAGNTYSFGKAASATWPMTWEMETFTFTATGDTTTLAFTGGSANYWGPAIDDVCVIAVPEPATYFAGLSLLALMSAASRRK